MNAQKRQNSGPKAPYGVNSPLEKENAATGRCNGFAMAMPTGSNL